MAYQYGPIVVGVDGSAHSIGALRWAADEAHRWTRTLLVINVVPADETAGEAPAQVADEAAAEARRWRVGIGVVSDARRGAPIAVLRRRAEDARLVVVGGRGAGAGADEALGSVSRALGRRADCPVLIVNNAQRWASPDAALPRAGPVVCGFDGSDSARRALRVAFGEASARSSRLVILQAWTHPHLWRPGTARGPDLSLDANAIHDALRDAIAPWCARYPLLEVEVRSDPLDPVPALAAASQWATLLVVGTRCPADRVQPTNPSIAARLLEYAACPVLVAHGPSRAPTAPAVSAATRP